MRNLQHLKRKKVPRKNNKLIKMMLRCKTKRKIIRRKEQQKMKRNLKSRRIMMIVVRNLRSNRKFIYRKRSTQPYVMLTFCR